MADAETEREQAEVMERLQEIRDEHAGNAIVQEVAGMAEIALEAIYELREERDRLMEAVEEIVTTGGGELVCMCDRKAEIARDALKAVEGDEEHEWREVKAHRREPFVMGLCRCGETEVWHESEFAPDCPAAPQDADASDDPWLDSELDRWAAAIEDGRSAYFGKADLDVRQEAARRLRRGGGEEVRCSKCGSDDIWTRYCDGRWIGGERKTGAVNACDRDHDGEQLHRVCRNCQHRWVDPTVSEERPGGSGEGYGPTILGQHINDLAKWLAGEVELRPRLRRDKMETLLLALADRLRRSTADGEGEPNVLDAVAEELASARDGFMDFPSAHHGYAVLLEEVDELWEEVQRFPRAPYDDNPAANAALRGEAVQVAAMAVRFIEDVTDHPAPDSEADNE